VFEIKSDDDLQMLKAQYAFMRRKLLWRCLTKQ